MFRVPKTYRWQVLAWVLAFGIFSITAWQQVSWPTFSSPDETANYAFAQQDRQTSATRIPTTLPGAPRSVINTGTALVPGSFVFFPHLLGFVGKVAGTLGMLLFGPALAASAVLAWYVLLRTLFGSEKFAVASTIILATVPTFWFYANRGFWQNGVFTSVLILAVAATAWAWKARQWGVSALSGLLWGVVVAIRPSEVAWLIPGLVVAFGLNWRALPWKQFGIALGTAVVPVLALFLFQWQTYSNPTAIGYRTTGAFDPAPIVQQLSTFHQVKNVFFPFGTNIGTAWERFQKYGVTPLSYVVLPSLLGLGWLLWRGPHAAKKFIVAGLVSGFFLFVLYGNYAFIEYPAVREAVLDGSYLRYWLPLLVLVSIGWGGIVTMLWQHSVGKRLAYPLVGAVLAVNFVLIVSDDTIGLAKTLPRIREAQAQSRWIIDNTPTNALVLAGNRDKLVFPRRHSIGFNTTIPLRKNFSGPVGDYPVFVVMSNVHQAKELEVTYPEFRVVVVDDVGPNIALAQLLPR